VKQLLSLFVLFFCVLQITKAQVKASEIEKTEANKLRADIHGNLYLLAKNHIYKYNPQSQERMNYSGRSSLNFSDFDLSDPFKIIVYDNSFREFLVFDKQLKLLSNIQFPLPDEFIEDPLFVRNNQAFYLFKPETNELYKYSLNFQFIKKSYLPEMQSYEITELRTADNKLFFLSKNDQIFSFSSEAAFIGQYYISDFETGNAVKPVFIQIDNVNSQIKLIDPLNKSNKTICIGNQEEIIKAAALHNESLFFISGNSLKQANLD
jgi:hypothetical protein